MTIDTSKAALCWPNRVEEGVLTSSGTWEAAFPLANLQTYLLPETARTSDGTTTQITLTISPRDIGAIALAGHNLTSTATWRVRLYSDAGATTLVYDSTVINAFDVSGDDAAILPPLSYLFAGDNYSTQVIKIDIVDSSNGDGFLEFGRLFVGPIWQAAINVLYGYGSDGIDGTEEQAAVDRKTKYYDEAEVIRSDSMTFPALTREEAYLVVQKMRMRLGKKGDLLFAKDLLGDSTARMTTYLATLQAMNPITQPQFDRHQVGLSLIEKR